ncbi:MAG: MFS transporter [Pseudomonadota bacterium]
MNNVYPIVRVLVALALISISGSVMYFAIVALKLIASDFEISRGLASMPYSATMLGFGLGGIAMGYLSDKVGVMPVVLMGGFAMTMGYGLASQADTVFGYAAYHCLLLAFFGAGTMFAPLVSDISHWFDARRGAAVGVVISGSYVAGTIWPLVAQHYFDLYGWRESYSLMSWFCLVSIVPLALVLYPKPPTAAADAAVANQPSGERPLGMRPAGLQCLLCLAGIGCCAAMAVPQVHIVAFATDLGYSATRGAEMLALMLGGGIISRLVSGWLSDRIGGLSALILGSALQGIMVASFLFADGLVMMYVLSALFGLSQGGIVPSYTLIVRRFFAASQAGWRIGVTLFFTMLGMALGGWLAGELFFRTGSYDAAFMMGVGFNLLNLVIASTLWLRDRPKLETRGS